MPGAEALRAVKSGEIGLQPVPLEIGRDVNSIGRATWLGLTSAQQLTMRFPVGDSFDAPSALARRNTGGGFCLTPRFAPSPD
jgi:hypothetical protein